MPPLPPNGLSVWELGKRKNWDKLTKYVINCKMDAIVVTDPSSEKHCSSFRIAVNASRNPVDSNGLIHELVGPHDVHGPHKLLTGVLAAGLDPDLPNARGLRPSHIAAINNCLQCLEIIYMCRPDLTPKSSESGLGHSAAMASIPGNGGENNAKVSQQIQEFLGSTDEKRFPSIATLAMQGEFWALKSLCRREVVQKKEYSELVEGRNVFSWLLYNGKPGLEREVRFFFQKSHAAVPRPRSRMTSSLSASLGQLSIAPKPQHVVEKPVAAKRVLSGSTSNLVLPDVRRRETVPTPDADTVHPLETNANGDKARLTDVVTVERTAEAEVVDDEDGLDELRMQSASDTERIESKIGALSARVDELERFEESFRSSDAVGSRSESLGAVAEDPLQRVVKGLLAQFTKMPGDRITYDLVEDLLKIVKKHNKPSS